MAKTLNWDKIRHTEISLTTYCQASCPLCGRTDPITLKKVDWLPLKHFPFEKLKKTVLDIRKANPRLEIINLCGDYGDPMMHPDIENIIEFLTEYQTSVLILGEIILLCEKTRAFS